MLADADYTVNPTAEGMHLLILIVASSSVTLLAFFSVCLYCFKRRKDSEEDDEDGELAGLRSGKKQSTSSMFSFTGQPTEYGRSKKTSIAFPSGHPVEPGLKEVNVQPYSKEMFPPFDSAVVLPPEPDPPSDRNHDLGTLHFEVSYNVYDLVLRLYIQKAIGLPAKDLSGTSDPFVKVILLPDKKQKLETRVKRKSLNPVWNEEFCFEGFPMDKLLQRTLYLQVLDYDRFSRNDPIGEVELPLANIHLQAEAVPFIKKLMPSRKSADYLGDLLISMCYNPTASRISVVVMKSTNLKVMDLTGSCDPYCKIYLMYSGKRIDKKKTAHKKRTLQPVWNEAFDFDVPIDKIRDISFMFTVMDFDRVFVNEAIGQVIIGYRTAGTSLKHWTDMMNSPRKPIAMWHQIIKY